MGFLGRHREVSGGVARGWKGLKGRKGPKGLKIADGRWLETGAGNGCLPGFARFLN